MDLCRKSHSKELEASFFFEGMNKVSHVASHHSLDDIIANTFAASAYTPVSLTTTLSGLPKSIILIDTEERGDGQSN